MTTECAFIGVLGRDAEVKTSAKGKSFSRLNVRTGEVEDAQWVAVTSFDQEAIRQASSFTKGSKIYVEGRLQLNSWTGEGGVPRTGLAVFANHTRSISIGRQKAGDGDNGYHRSHRRDEGDGYADAMGSMGSANFRR
jgi:single-stranded DNA-binding protein